MMSKKKKSPLIGASAAVAVFIACCFLPLLSSQSSEKQDNDSLALLVPRAADESSSSRRPVSRKVNSVTRDPLKQVSFVPTEFRSSEPGAGDFDAVSFNAAADVSDSGGYQATTYTEEDRDLQTYDTRVEPATAPTQIENAGEPHGGQQKLGGYVYITKDASIRIAQTPTEGMHQLDGSGDFHYEYAQELGFSTDAQLATELRMAQLQGEHYTLPSSTTFIVRLVSGAYLGNAQEVYFLLSGISPFVPYKQDVRFTAGEYRLVARLSEFDPEQRRAKIEIVNISAVDDFGNVYTAHKDGKAHGRLGILTAFEHFGLSYIDVQVRGNLFVLEPGQDVIVLLDKPIERLSSIGSVASN